jgi:glycerophosphoryl diester phosphodiesterase
MYSDETYASWETGFYRDRPLVIAHRGASGVAPENTLAAFEAAIEAKADAVELDVTRCGSGELVVIHDETVDRTTNGSGLVRTMSYLVLRDLDAGCRFPEDTDACREFRGQRIPLLSEVLDLVGDRALLNIEVKGQRLRDERIEVDVAELVRDRGLEARVVMSSFNPLSLRRMRMVAPELQRGLLYTTQMPFYLARAWSRAFVRPHALHPHYTMVDERYVRWAKRGGYRVNVWTVNHLAEMERLIVLGVDGIITNHPSLLRGLLPD